jgi:hypothetical protein
MLTANPDFKARFGLQPISKCYAHQAPYSLNIEHSEWIVL